MRKTFPLEIEGIKAPRVIEAIKNDVRKYLKRERRKSLPDDVDYWDFDCKTGSNPDAPSDTHVSALIAAIDTAAQENWPNIYIEILAKPGHRNPKAPKAPETEDDSPRDTETEGDSPKDGEGDAVQPSA